MPHQGHVTGCPYPNPVWREPVVPQSRGRPVAHRTLCPPSAPTEKEERGLARTGVPLVTGGSQASPRARRPRGQGQAQWRGTRQGGGGGGWTSSGLFRRPTGSLCWLLSRRMWGHRRPPPRPIRTPGKSSGAPAGTGRPAVAKATTIVLRLVGAWRSGESTALVFYAAIAAGTAASATKREIPSSRGEPDQRTSGSVPRMPLVRVPWTEAEAV
jgi:hypothetical protein